MLLVARVRRFTAFPGLLSTHPPMSNTKVFVLVGISKFSDWNLNVSL